MSWCKVPRAVAVFADVRANEELNCSAAEQSFLEDVCP